MFPSVEHQLTPELCYIELWCPKCKDNVGHDLVVRTDNEVLRIADRSMGDRYVDTNVITAIVRSCIGCQNENVQTVG